MIKRNGKILTPKQLAAKIIESDLCIVTDYWTEREADVAEGMTENEKLAVDRQLQSYANRILKLTDPATRKL